MNPRALAAIAIVAIAFLAGGCSPGQEADTSPLPNKDPEARVDSATRSIEASKMSPEEKQAAVNYLKQGQANAEQMKRQAPGLSAKK